MAFSENSIFPAISEKSVKSLPMPTFMPGRNLVPFWRTMISPALTTCPPKRLTPRRLALESRPFLLEPPAFLCAIF